MDFSIVIPSFNRAAHLRRLLESISELEVPEQLRWEILVVDNNSTDNTREIVHAFARENNLDVSYHFQHKQGASQARNFGIDKAEGDIIAFLDDDEIVDTRWMKAVLEGFSDQRFVAMGGMITAKWLTPVPSWYTLKGRHRIVGPTAEHNRGEVKRPYDLKKDSLPATGNFAARRAVFETYGKFRTDMGPVGQDYFIGEDTEFCIRILKAGERIVYLPGAKVYNTVHEHRLSKAYCRKYHFRFGRSLAQLGRDSATIKRWGSLPRYLLREFVGAIIYLLLSPVLYGTKSVFFYELQLARILGQIYESLFFRKLETLDEFWPSTCTTADKVNKTRILFLHHGGSLIRGSERCLLMLLERLNRDHFYPEVICNQFSLKREIEKLNVRAHRIDFPEITIDGEFKKIEILKYFKTLRIISLTLRKRHFDLIYSNSGLPCQIGLPLSKLFRIPILVHLHAPHPLRYAWMWLFKYADKVLFVSHYIKEQLTSKVKLKGHAAVAYNGVDCDYVFHPVERRDFRMKAELGWAENDIVIGQVGSLIRRKGLDILIKAFYRLRTMRRGDEVKLLIIGDGSLRRELEAQVTNLGIGEKVRFTGETDHPSRYYQHAIDINVLASRSEAFPLSLLEASACGVPNVCTRCEGMIEGVIDGSTGLHFEKENSEDLADKLRILIENPSLCRKMGKNGRRLVERNFSAENYARRIQLEIRNLVQQGGSKSSLNRLFGRTRMTGAID